MNKVILSGNVCKDVELKQTSNGKSVSSNTIAVKRDFKEANEYKTDFINFTLWNHQADYFAKYAKKGDRVEIVGRWQTREYEDANSNKRTANEVVVESVYVYAKKDDGLVFGSTNTDDDLPF